MPSSVKKIDRLNTLLLKLISIFRGIGKTKSKIINVSPNVKLTLKLFCIKIIPQEKPTINNEGMNPPTKDCILSFLLAKNEAINIIEPSFIASEGMKVVNPKFIHLLAPLSSIPRGVKISRPEIIDPI